MIEKERREKSIIESLEKLEKGKRLFKQVISNPCIDEKKLAEVDELIEHNTPIMIQARDMLIVLEHQLDNKHKEFEEKYNNGDWNDLEIDYRFYSNHKEHARAIFFNKHNRNLEMYKLGILIGNLYEFNKDLSIEFKRKLRIKYNQTDIEHLKRNNFEL